MAVKTIYDIETTPSVCKSHHWQGWAEALQHFAAANKGWVVASLHYGVFVGAITNGKIAWLPDYGKEGAAATGLPRLESDGYPDENQIAELRLFDADKELYFWRDGNTLQGRLRQDGTGDDEVMYTEANLYTRGVVSIKLFNHLGTQKGDPVFITTRNYIGQNAIHQAGYVDCRFVEFKK